MASNDAAAAFAQRCASGPRVDLGCGPGRFTADLGRPVVAIDAARAMLDLARDAAPGAVLVQGDLEVPPFRDRSLTGAWATASYVHVPRVNLPLALARLHWALQPGAPFHLVMFAGEYEGSALPADDFPGRFFAQWDPDALLAVVTGAGFTIERTGRDGDRVAIDAVR